VAVRAAWNVLTLLAFVLAGLGTYVSVRLGAWWTPLAALPVLAACSWGFYRQRYVSWRTLVGWTYTGVALGTLGAVGSAASPFWLAAALVLATGTVLLLLPGLMNGWVWTAALLRARPAGWTDAAPQDRETVLAVSPFTLHEVVKVREVLQGGVVQQEDRRVDRLEIRYGGDAVHSGQKAADLEDWVLARYRQYRRLQRLPLSPDLAPTREVTREEATRLDPYGSDGWHGTRELTREEVLATSPVHLDVTFLGQPGPYRAEYAPGTPRRFTFMQGREYDELLDDDVPERGWIVERVNLVLTATGRVLGSEPDLDDAERAVLARYRAQRDRQRTS